MVELSRDDVARLDKEIHEERRSDIRLAVDSWFAMNEERLVAILVRANVAALDKWSKERSEKWLARLGVIALLAMIMTFLGYLGWKGWGGK
jgi:hypothetical protein